MLVHAAGKSSFNRDRMGESSHELPGEGTSAETQVQDSSHRFQSRFQKASVKWSKLMEMEDR